VSRLGPHRNLPDTLKLIGRSAGARLDTKTALELCQRAGSKAVLAGSITSLGSEYIMELKAIHCPAVHWQGIGSGGR
jgi:hypothetical protein